MPKRRAVRTKRGPLRCVATGAMTNIARGEQASARIAAVASPDHHAVHENQFSGLKVNERELVLGRDSFCNGAVRAEDVGPKRTVAPAASGARATRTLSRGSSCNTVSGMGIIPWNEESAEGSAHFRQGYNLRDATGCRAARLSSRVHDRRSWGETEMKAVVLEGPGQASIKDVQERGSRQTTRYCFRYAWWGYAEVI